MRYDGDRSGALDKEEIKRALDDLEIPGDEVSVETLFSTLDKNKDGSIELREWLDFLPAGTRIRVVSKFGEDGALAFEEGSALNEYRHVRIELPMAKIVYTFTDEAPMLATYSLLPMVRAVTRSSGVDLELSDISVAGRILANFPDKLTELQRQRDELAELGELCKTPAANVIKLPNVSASIPQLEACIAELQEQGYAVPDYPAEPANADEEKIKARYAKVLGSAVNPVLREGNSDRRVAAPVKSFAQKNPHKMGEWSAESKTHVSHMEAGDFFASEQSHTCASPCSVRIEHVDAATGAATTLKAKTPLQAGEVIDSAFMSVGQLQAFLEKEIVDAKSKDILFSLHLKATMMKVSDPIMFGHCVKVYFREVFEKHGATFAKLGVNANNGLGDVYAKIASLPAAERDAIAADIAACQAARGDMAMVDSGKGITNLHVPSDIIIDASIPPVIRDSGKMWNKDDALQDCKMVVPDRCYAKQYQAIVEDCQVNGKFDVSTMGAVSNVGLMAQKAEEYGSHDKTFEVASKGVMRVVDNATDETVFSHEVEQGDIWRMCQTKDAPIQDWVKLAVSRARATGAAAIFWLSEERAHDRSLIAKVNGYLADHDTSGLDITIQPPEAAMKATLARARDGLDTISVTGNVLRDYLTDLFPIIELGTSAKMLSIVPLLAGGGLFETGAGGSAPKHVQQLQKEGHLRWDSLGEFLALAVSLEDLGVKTNNAKAKVLATALNAGIGRLLDENKSPGRKVGQLDNRGSHYFLVRFWTEALAAQGENAELANEFAPVARALAENEGKILAELLASAGSPADIGGYYKPDDAKAEIIMRPSATLNGIIDPLLKKSLARAAGSGGVEAMAA